MKTYVKKQKWKRNNIYIYIYYALQHLNNSDNIALREGKEKENDVDDG